MSAKKEEAKTAANAGSVMVVGGISIDLATFSAKLPAAGESLLGDDFKLVLGGKGSNQAIAASLAGAKSRLVSCVGTDLFTDFALSTLKDFDVDTSFVEIVSGPTGIAHIRVDSKGENNIVIVPLANSKITKSQVDRAFKEAPETKVLLVQLEIPWEINLHAIKKAKAAGMQVILDPAPADPIEESTWKLIDIVTPNESEALSLTGINVHDQESAEASGKWFLKRGVKNALITMGAKGVVLVSEKTCKTFTAPAVNVIDSTAAGDAFAGNLGALLAIGLELETAIQQAVVAASLSVTKPGASTSLPSRQEVLKALKNS
jgi:ribokinase